MFLQIVCPFFNQLVCFLLLLTCIIYNILQFSVPRSFTPLVKFTSSYFIFFVAIANEIVFLISLSASLLFVHRNVTGFYILILYPAILWVFKIFSSSFW